MKSKWREIVAKHEKDSAATKESVLQVYKDILGKDRAGLREHVLDLIFNPKNEKEFIQLNRVGKLLGAASIHYSAWMKRDDCIVSIPVIEKDMQNTLNILQYIAGRLVVRELEGTDKSPLLISPVDPFHALVEATETPWYIRHKSPYGSDTLEPSRSSTVDPEQRRTEEFALGYRLFGNRKSGPRGDRGDVEGWLQHQEQVESQQGVKPHTAIPLDWADETHVDRLGKRKKGALRSLFSKSTG